MKTEQEIRERIEEIEKQWGDEKNVPDYMRGVYDALKWAIGERD